MTHQVRAEAIIDRLHRLARAVEMDGTVMAVRFKGGACGESGGTKSIFTTAINSKKEKKKKKGPSSETVHNDKTTRVKYCTIITAAEENLGKM